MKCGGGARRGTSSRGRARPSRGRGSHGGSAGSGRFPAATPAAGPANASAPPPCLDRGGRGATARHERLQACDGRRAPAPLVAGPRSRHESASDGCSTCSPSVGRDRGPFQACSRRSPFGTTDALDVLVPAMEPGILQTVVVTCGDRSELARTLEVVAGEVDAGEGTGGPERRGGWRCSINECSRASWNPTTQASSAAFRTATTSTSVSGRCPVVTERLSRTRFEALDQSPRARAAW